MNWIQTSLEKFFHPARYHAKQLSEEAEAYANHSGILMHYREARRANALERLLICLTRGLMFAMIIIGTIGCFVSALNLPASMLVISLVVLAVSLYISALYFNKIAYNIGLITLFLGFMYLTAINYRYVNSGWSAVLNVMLERLDELWNLEGYRTYTETITSRSITITIAMIFIGICVVIVMNSIYQASRKMSAFLGCSIGVLCVCFFLELMPGAFWIALMFCGYLTVYMTIMSGHSLLPDANEGVTRWRGKKGKRDEQLERAMRGGITLGKHKKLSRKEKKALREERQEYVLHDNGTHSLWSLGLMSLVSIVLCLGMMLYQTFAYVPPVKDTNIIRHMLNDSVRDYVLYGVAGLFSDYASNGGVSSGQLGGVRSVSLDFETDLVVTYVPHSVDRVFIGSQSYDYYSDNCWGISQELIDTGSTRVGASWDNATTVAYLEKETNAIAAYLATTELSEMETNGAGAFKSVMQIEMKEFSAMGLHRPYYSILSGQSTGFPIYEMNSANPMFEMTQTLYGDLTWGWNQRQGTYQMTYYGLSGDMTPDQMAEFVKQNPDLYQTEQAFIEEYLDCYLEVPEEIQKDLDQFMDEKGIRGDRDTVIQKLLELYEEEYLYTYSPGKTPKNQDFVLYFLRNQKKGYCVYFATSACMMLRANGIPARYTEGYALDYEDLMDGEILTEESYEDWYQGYNPLGKTAVAKVDLTDASAHAWVEVYYEGFGWVPVEFTVSDMESGDYSTFWNDFSSLFDTNTTSNGENNNFDFGANGKEIVNMTGRSLLIFVIIMSVALMALYLILKIRLYLSLHILGSGRMRMIRQYQLINALLFTEGGLHLKNNETMPRDFVNNYHSRTRDLILSELTLDGVDAARITEWIDLVVKASYGSAKLEDAVVKQSEQTYRAVRKAIYRKYSFLKRCKVGFREGIFFH